MQPIVPLAHDKPCAMNQPEDVQIMSGICPGKKLLEELHAPENKEKPAVKNNKRLLHKNLQSVKANDERCFNSKHCSCTL